MNLFCFLFCILTLLFLCIFISQFTFSDCLYYFITSCLHLLSFLSYPQLLCSTVQKAFFEEEEKVKTLWQKVKVLEKANNHLRDKVKNLKRLLRLAKRETKDQTGLLKQLHEPEPELPHPQQDTTQVQKPVNRKILPRKLKT